MKTAMVGNINMDMTVIVEKIPLKRETLKGENTRYIPGGEGTNQAVAMAKLGADAEMFDCVSDDETGRGLMKNMGDMGVGTTHIKAAPGVNTGLTVITVGDHDNMIAVMTEANDRMDRKYVDGVEDALLACDIVLLQHETPQDAIEYAIDICHENSVKVILNPGLARPVKPEVLAKVDYPTPNGHEAVILFGDMPVGEMLKAYLGRLVVTQGSKGIPTCPPMGEILIIPARKANVVDTARAGDTLNRAFTVQTVGGSTMEETFRFASTAANLSTERLGAQGGMPIRNRVLEAMHQERMQRTDRHAFGVKRAEG